MADVRVKISVGLVDGSYEELGNLADVMRQHSIRRIRVDKESA